MLNEQIVSQLMEEFEPNYKLGESDIAWFAPKLNDALEATVGKVAIEHHKMVQKERNEARKKAKGSKPKGGNPESGESETEDASKKRKKPTKGTTASADAAPAVTEQAES